MIPLKLQEYIDDLKLLGTREEYYEQMLDYAKKLPDLDEKFKTEENKVPGCVSNVHITAENKEEKVYFQGSSDALLVKGIVYILIDSLSGLTGEDIQKVPEQVIIDLGVDKSLTPTRMNATYNILRMIKEKAKKE